MDAQQQAADFLEHRQEFQLHALLTEQRHPCTWQLSRRVQADVAAGLRDLWQVDADIAALLARLDTVHGPLPQARDAILRAWRGGHRLFIYGCGSTGRLAKTLEAGMWRRLWRRLDALGLASRVEAALPRLRHALVGEITGGDRAIISSLEGFEDLPQMGALQLQEHAIGAADVVMAVSEGGETSSVIGALRAARALQPAAAPAASDQQPSNLYFVYNNPEAQLQRLGRSRAILEDAHIGRLMLATGPQALAGSTRMQATTTSLFVLGCLLEDALEALLPACLSAAELRALGLMQVPTLAAKLQGFAPLLAAVTAEGEAVAALTRAEAATYAQGGRVLYLAQDALMTVFTDATERAPTFRLAPLDPVDAAAEQGRRSWLHVLSAAPTPAAAWECLLGRPFAGLDGVHYAAALRADVDDAGLLRVALHSLERAGCAEGARYDLSQGVLARPGWALRPIDLTVEVRLGEEDASAFAELPRGHAPRALVQVCAGPAPGVTSESVAAAAAVGVRVPAPALEIHLNVADDPLGLRQQVALKLLLNAHSTAVMALRGRLMGNTMVFVQPSNLKLIGRATFLVQSHVNDLTGPPQAPLSYAAANLLIFEALAFRRSLGQAADDAPSETILAIARATLSRRLGTPVSWEEALARAGEAWQDLPDA